MALPDPVAVKMDVMATRVIVMASGNDQHHSKH